MNSSQFMDKQITALSRSQNNDFLDLLNPQEEQPYSGGGGGKKEIKEEILPSYDFQPIRQERASQLINIDGSNVGGTRVWKSVESKSNSSNLRTYGSLDISASANVTQEKDCHTYDPVMMSEIDQTMKKHTDKLLHALEGVSARLSQLESRTRHLESSVDDFQVSIGNNHGNTDGKLRQLENILREVQTCVQFLQDKQELAEAQLQLAKLQASKGGQQSENQNSTERTDSVQQTASALQQSQQPLMPPVLPQPSHPLPALPPLSAPPPPAQQKTSPVPLPSQLPQSQIPSIPQRDSYFPPPGQLLEAAHQHYQLPPAHQLQLPAPALNQPYQSASQLPQYSLPPQLPQQYPPVSPVNPPPQPQLPVSHHPEETPYMPPQSYPPSNHQSPSMSQPPTGAPPSQQFYGAPPNMYDPSGSRVSSGFLSGYGSSSESNFSDPYSYSGPPFLYGSSTMKPPHLSSFSSPSGGGSINPRLPMAQILPHALPTASSDGDGSGNRVPVDDVVDKVALMGFPRDQVRATVRKLTENGQSVDLNVVLDKLMNEGEVQPQEGWFDR